MSQELVHAVHVYLEDSAELNELLEDYEFTTERIELAAQMIIEQFNLYPPRTYMDEETIPKSILLPGIASDLLHSVAALKIRNQLNYNDNGVHIITDDTSQGYSALANTYKQQFMRNMINHKSAINMQNGWGGV